MLKAEQLMDLAHKAADIAQSATDANTLDLEIAQQALITCAIYTVGAEIIGRLDSLHFEFEMREPGSHYHFRGSGRLFTKRSNNDNSSKSKNSSADQEGAPTPTSAERQRREGVKGP